MRYLLLLVASIAMGYMVSCQGQPRVHQPAVYRNHPFLLAFLGIVPFLVVFFASLRNSWASVAEAVGVYAGFSSIAYIVRKHSMNAGPRR